MGRPLTDESSEEKCYCIEATTGRRFRFDRFPEFRQTAPNKYLARNLTKHQAKALAAKLKLSGYNVILYRNIWNKGNNYRRIFLETQPDPCRCVYCGKFFPKDSITVDHVIPADLAKRSSLTRLKLKKLGYESIDDPRNLVAAYHKCNSRKKNLNLFRYRFLACFGRYDWFWRLRLVLLISAGIAVLFVTGLIISYLLSHPVSEIITTIQQAIEKTMLKIVDRILGE